MSAICTEFVQNAWKRDLCSNCFKAKADHTAPSPAEDSRGAPWEPPESDGCKEKEAPTPPRKTTNEKYASSKRTILEMHKGMVSNQSPNGLNHNNNAVNTSKSNGVAARFIKNRQDAPSGGLHSSPRKIGSSGVHLWELGRMPDKSVPIVNGVDGKEAAVNGESAGKGPDAESAPVTGILKDGKPTTTKDLNPRTPPSNGEARRGSVGFIEGSPKVIGYGGNDYDWGDDQDSSEEPSDVDSLENYDLTEEDQAFNRLTDRNTEYNADNTNLLLNQPVNSASIFQGKGTSLVDKLTPQSFYSMPGSRTTAAHKNATVSPDATGPQPSDQVQSFVQANVLNGDEEPATFLDEEDSGEDDGTMVVRTCLPPAPSRGQSAAVSSRAGCETIPSRKYPSAPRTSVQQLFSEEPVTAAELQAATRKLQPFRGREVEVKLARDNDDVDSSCSPYGVVSISDIAKEDVQPGTSSPPVVPACPPPASDDEVQKLPVQPKSGGTQADSCKTPVGNLPSGKAAPNQVLARDHKIPPSPLSLASKEEPGASPKSTVGVCSTFHTPSPKDTDAKFWNREYAAVNYSCHYASSYIRTGISVPSSTTANPEKAVRSPTSSSLPPTPLTNPYSSTAILKGIPKQPQNSPEQSPQKPPVTKPKPKLLAKPHISPKIPGGGLQVQGSEPVVGQGSPEHVSLQSFITDSPVRKSDAAMDSPDATSFSENEDGPSSPVDSVVPASDDGRAASPEVGSDQPRCRTSFELKMASLTNTLDFNKRGPKRQAPRPPQDARASKGEDRVSLSSDHSFVSPTNSDSQTRITPEHRHPVSTTATISPPSAVVPVTCDPTVKANVVTTSTPNVNGYESHVSIKGSVHKETKQKKSRFSLKKLLKFGSKDDHDDSSPKWKSRSSPHGDSHHHERRTKLEILHPIDLINSARNDQLSASSENKMTAGTSSSSKTSSIDSHHGLQLAADELQAGQDGPAYSVMTVANHGSVSDPADEQHSLSRYKPPPPPRSRSHLDEPSKDKPVRPPPPTKRTHPLTKGQALSSSLEDIHDSTPVHRPKNKSNGSIQHEDKRNSCYSTSMEYANLGDIRNNLAPKKPGRCVSSSMMDIAYMEQDSYNGRRSTSHENLYEVQETRAAAEVVTYYEPTGDQWLEDRQFNDLDELYADQCAVGTDQSEPSSIGSNRPFQESSDCIHKNGLLDAANGENQDGSECCNKVYERVVLKRGNLEKVYAKFPVAARQADSDNVASTVVSDVEETVAGDLGAVLWPRRKSSRLSLRKAKTVVHKNLEDNYGAVVSANHQTLTQILEQVSITQHATASKIKLLEEAPPHWSDFKLVEDSQVTMVGEKAFYSAVWQQNVELTLMASQEPLCAASQSTRNPCVLVPIVEFEDAVPFSLFSKPTSDSEEVFCHGTVWVMERMRVETLSSVAESLHLQSETDMEGYEREVCFILLQLINALKHLQVLGIEEVDANCSDFILIMKSSDANYRLVIIPKPSSISDGYRTPSSAAQEKLSLCGHALATMFLLFNVESPAAQLRLDADRLEIPSRVPSSEAFRSIATTLRQERATSLSQAKLLLEYLLWGPTDLNGEGRANGGNTPTDGADQELAYQRWLDLERATVLNNLIRTQSLWQIRLTVFEEYMLSFLVRTCAKMLRDAARQLQMNETKRT